MKHDSETRDLLDTLQKQLAILLAMLILLDRDIYQGLKRKSLRTLSLKNIDDYMPRRIFEGEGFKNLM